MKLYELTNEMNTISENLEAVIAWEPVTDTDGNPIDDDGNIIKDVEAYRTDMLSAWYDTLAAIEGEFDIKAGNIAAYIKNLKAEAEALHKEERALRYRRNVKEKALDHMISYLMNEMENTNKRKIDTPQAQISIRNNAESVSVEDEKGFIEWAQANDKDELLKYSAPEIRKSEVRKYIQSGGEVPCAKLVRTQSLIVK